MATNNDYPSCSKKTSESAQASPQPEDEESEPGFIVMRGYREEDPAPRLLGNQMAMVLPRPMSDQVIVDEFGRPPARRRKGFASLSLSERFEYLFRLQLFHHVFQSHIDFIHKVIAVVRMSFLSRDARVRDVMAFIWNVIARAPVSYPRPNDVGGGGLGILVVGPSGVGKASLIDRIVDYLKAKARIHLTIGNRRARWMQRGVATQGIAAGGNALSKEYRVTTPGKWELRLAVFRWFWHELR